MGFYEKRILPRVINCACGTKPIMKQREKIVPAGQRDSAGDRYRDRA